VFRKFKFRLTWTKTTEIACVKDAAQILFMLEIYGNVRIISVVAWIRSRTYAQLQNQKQSCY